MMKCDIDSDHCMFRFTRTKQINAKVTESPDHLIQLPALCLTISHMPPPRDIGQQFAVSTSYMNIKSCLTGIAVSRMENSDLKKNFSIFQ